MKVLKKGREQKGWSKEFKCSGSGNGGGGCGAKLLVSEYDLYYTESHHYDGSSERYVTFACCDCGVETDVSWSSVSGAHVRGKRSAAAARKSAGD